MEERASSQDMSDGEEEMCRAEEQDQQPPGTGPYATLHGEGPQLSTGSAGHPDSCMPCTFYCFTRRGCNRGLECRFCHLTHQSKLQQRREAWKKQQREKRKSIRERVAAEALARKHSGSGSGKGGHALEDSDGGFTGGAVGASPTNGDRHKGPGPRKSSDLSSEGSGPAGATAVFTYTPGRAILTIGQEVEFKPHLSTRASSFRLNVALPQGLALDPHTGIMSGSPVVPAAKMTVVVEADLGGRLAHAVVDLEVVDFTRGGFVIGHMSEPEPGKFMMLLYVPEEDQGKGQPELAMMAGRPGAYGLPASARKATVGGFGGAAKQKQQSALAAANAVDPAAAMRAMARANRTRVNGGPASWEEPKPAMTTAAASTLLEWW